MVNLVQWKGELWRLSDRPFLEEGTDQDQENEEEPCAIYNLWDKNKDYLEMKQAIGLGSLGHRS